MKRVSFITLLFIWVLALPAFAQTTAQPAATRIGIVNTEAFYADKTGITKLLAAYAALDKEFEGANRELVTLNARIETLAKEIQTLQTQLNNTASGPPIDANSIRNSIATKNDEGARLQIDAKRKQEDAKAAYDKREAIVAGPIKREIGLAIDEYARQKGFSMVLDGAKMMDAGILITIDQKIDMTDDFIKYFNAKPATPAGVPAKAN